MESDSNEYFMTQHERLQMGAQIQQEYHTKMSVSRQSFKARIFIPLLQETERLIRCLFQRYSAFHLIRWYL